MTTNSVTLGAGETCFFSGHSKKVLFQALPESEDTVQTSEVDQNMPTKEPEGNYQPHK